MKPYLKITHFKVPLYHGYLVIIFSNSVKKLKKYIPGFPDDDIYASSYFHKFNKKQGFFIILNFNNDLGNIYHGTIIHESIHITHFILKNIGMEKSYDNDEAETYLAEWITNKVYKCIKQNNFTVR